MAGDPQECRQHALTCVRLAQTSHPHKTEEFANFANTWLRLATDLEQARAFLDAMDDADEAPTEADALA